MELTPREREILDLLRIDPLLGAEAMAARLSTTRAAVNVHLSNLGRKGAILGRGYVLRSQPVAVVAGGANLDIKSRSSAPVEAATSNPGTTTTSPGGVARNIAENLARLGTQTHLLAAVGADSIGQEILEATASAGVRTEHVLRSARRTGTYTAVLDHRGELVVAVADMTASAEVDEAAIDKARAVIGAANLLVLDGNLSAGALRAALGIADQRSVPVVIDPVSVPKARLLAPVLDGRCRVDTITPNVEELGALVAREIGNDDLEAIGQAARELHDLGIEHVWIRRGRLGSVLSSAGEGITKASVLRAPRVKVADVTGAGDAMLAAYCHGLLSGATRRQAALAGHAAAAATLASEHTVRPDIAELLGDHDRRRS